MAFGFGFNKQKALSAAEKFVQQGKLQNAIAEYDKVLKNDAKDLTVNNTIGDLYSRLGDSAKAIECFKKVGDAYAAQGFTVKGIAMYKKIAKLQPSVDSSLKLAELYTQQGLFNDARAQYLQVAEDFMKNGDMEQAVRIFQKVLEMDPENVPMRVKLADVYVKLGKKKDAWEILSAVAELLRSRGSLAAADDILNGMLALDPGNSYVLLLRGKSAVESGDSKSAIGFLEKAADLDSHPEGLRDLLKAYLQLGNLKKAAPISEKLLAVHNDPEGLFLLAESCTRQGQYREALDVYTRHADRLLAIDSTKLLASLHSMITHVRDDSGSLDALLLLLNKAGESTHVNEVTELLAHASVEDGNLARARDLYQMLATTEPQNSLHMQNYQQVVGRMTSDSPPTGITAEEGALIVEELEATAPVVDQSYPDEIAIAVRSAVTDADLFLSYNLPDKAVVPLLGALPKAPCDARLNQRLAALHTRFHRFTEAAVCCRTLESVYRDAGYPDEAMRYGELAVRYEHSALAATAPDESLSAASGSTESASAASVFAAAAASASSSGSSSFASLSSESKPSGLKSSESKVAASGSSGRAAEATPWPVAPVASVSETGPVNHPEFPIPEMGVHAPFEVHDHLQGDHLQDGHSSDLASEWESSLTADSDAGEQTRQVALPSAGEGETEASNSEIAETVEEIRFYREHFMMDQAKAAMEKLETLTSDPAILDPLRATLSSTDLAPDEPEIAEIEIADGDIADIEIPDSEIRDFEIPRISADEPADFEVAVEAETGPEVTSASNLMSGFHHETGDESHTHLSHELHQPAVAEDGHELQSAGVEVASADTIPVTANVLPSFVAELEASLGDSFPIAPPPAAEAPVVQPSAAHHLPAWPAISAPAPEPVALESIASSVHSEIDISANLPVETVTATPAGVAATATAPARIPVTPSPAAVAPETPAPVATTPAMSYGPVPDRPLGAGAQAMHPSGSIDLSEMFGELKHELEEEITAGDDDPETHYNLGVAFREMGLLDEAIAEFQKVCTAIDQGQAFSQLVQTYTWLAQCFLDKGVPEAAIRWYEKALSIPGLDQEGRMAINYELGSACESAQDKPAALRHFTSVYGANIDYRNVAERIQALKS